MNLKRLIIGIAAFFIVSSSFGQQRKFVYYLNDNLSSVDKSKATLLGKGDIENGLLKLDCFKNNTDQLVISAHFTDSSLSVLQGLFRVYYSITNIQTEGNFEKDEKQGLWQQWDTSGLKTDSMIYEKGVKIAYAKFEYHKNKTLSSYSFTDSLKNTMHEKYSSDKGKILSEVNFVGNNGVLISTDSTGKTKIDSVFTREEQEAKYDGDWVKYLQKNLKAQVPSDNRAPEGKYVCIVKFSVSTDGSISDISIEKKGGYGTDEEVIRVIKKSAKWIPAKQYGRFVKAYRRQPFTFLVQSK